MSDLNPRPQQDCGDRAAAAQAAPDRRRRGSLGVRAAAATVIAGGLAAGGYGVASAASSHSATDPVCQSGPRHGVEPFEVRAQSSALGWTGRPWARRQHSGPERAFGLGGTFGQGGTVTQVTPTTITVDSLFGSALTVTTDSSTVYSEGGKKVAALRGGCRRAGRLPPGSMAGILELERLAARHARRDRSAARLGQGRQRERVPARRLPARRVERHGEHLDVDDLRRGRTVGAGFRRSRSAPSSPSPGRCRPTTTRSTPRRSRSFCPRSQAV